MQEEGKSFRYQFFVTLTYSDAFVPKLYFKTIHNFDGTEERYLVNYKDGISYPESVFINPIDKDWIDHKKYIEYARYSDVQKFFKRLRMWYLRHAPKSDIKLVNYGKIEKPETFRYFCASEYGPSTIRPHYHMLLFFNSKWLAENFDKVIPSCWSLYNRVTKRRTPIGPRSQYRAANGDADRYTASYCDGVTGIPSLFRQSEIRPRHSYSRTPSLGSLQWDAEKISQKFFTGGLREFSGINKKGEPTLISIPESIIGKIFPKLPTFSTQSHADRVKCYGIYRFIKEYGKYENLDYKNFSFFVSQFQRYFMRCYPALSPYLDRHLRKKASPDVVKRPLYTLYLATKRFYELQEKYHLDSESLTTIIEDFYSLRNYYQLTDWYAYLEEVSKTESFKPYYSLYLGVGYGYKQKYPYRSASSFVDLKLFSDKMYRSRVKNKKERDYQLRGNAVIYEPKILENG